MAGPPGARGSGLHAFAADEEKASQLKRHLKDQQQVREEREQRRREEELQLVEQYKEFLHQARISKQEEVRARLNKLKAQAELKERQAEARAEQRPAASASQCSGQEAAPAGDNSAEVPGKEMVAKAAAVKSAKGKHPLKSPVSRSPQQETAGAETGDALLAKLNESRGFRRMLNALEQRDAVALLGMKGPPKQPLQSEEEGEDEAHLDEGQEGKDKSARVSQHHLARRYRLRTMQQVATEVLRGKKQLTGCFQEASHAPAMMAFG
eukprot:TRINITY_DN2086_c0_g1_i1.p1 TRINITY_DN2086_c0_g1~~TRINITY_DN2086_c0_g1_i1.p1  ORF type:complete len:266 (+),score=76.08 TRINITY_DN2086_c0_g1_i1:142-939(+)